MKILRWTAFILAVLLFGGALFTWFDLRRDLNTLEFSEISLSEVPNGIYVGKSSIGPVKVTAEVKVLNGEIDAIELLRHENGMGEQAEDLAWIMERRETWDVDCVTGATISSQAIRQAVNRALMSAVPSEE